jgi:hypothetical protein
MRLRWRFTNRQVAGLQRPLIIRAHEVGKGPVIVHNRCVIFAHKHRAFEPCILYFKKQRGADAFAKWCGDLQARHKD